jgi:hypothetical protein
MRHDAQTTFGIKKMNDTIKIRTWGAPAIGWIGIVFFGFCAVMSSRSGQYAPLLCFIPFILMSIPVILMAHTVKMDSEGVCAKTLQGTYQIAWNDVIEVQCGQSNILFKGASESQLIIPTPSLWSWAKKAEMLMLLGKHLEDRKVPLKRSLGCDFKFFKGTKIADPIK